MLTAAWDIRLSPSFTLDEFVTSQAATRRGLDNTPPAAAIDNLVRLCADVLQPLRDALARPVVVSSGYRSPAVNEAVGGATRPPSAHMEGRAADIGVPGMSPLDVCRQVIARRLPFDQVIYEGGWCHVSVAPAGTRPRGQVLTARFGGGDVQYTVGLWA